MNNIETDILDMAIAALSKDNAFGGRYSNTISEFRERISLNKANKIKIGIIGVTSSGKSTMINSLLGEKLLPSKVKPSSSQLVSCCKGPRMAEVKFKDGHTKVYKDRELTADVIGKYGDEEINPKNKEGVTNIVLSTPTFALPDEVLMLDSPGLDAYGFEGHEKLTMESLLPFVDCCIFVTTCKTNSDAKMRDVLNVIAAHNKPVVIVQNMIDSIKPSPDGKKSVVEIAQEHKRRVEKIVTESKIADKSTVKIVQISAQLAVDAMTNGIKTTADRKNFENSNFEKLRESIIANLNLIRPRISGARMADVKKRLGEIITEAENDGKEESQAVIPTFEFQDTEVQIGNVLTKAKNLIGSALSGLDSLYNSTTSEYSFTQSKLNSIKTKVNKSRDALTDSMRQFQTDVEGVCQKLNVQARDIVTPSNFYFSSDLSLSTKPKYETEWYTETVKVKRDTIGGKIKRKFGTIFGNDNWGYDYEEVQKSREVYAGEETDNSATRERALTYIERAKSAFGRTVDSWIEKAEKTKERINGEIAQRKAQYDERIKSLKNNSVEKQRYRTLAEELRRIKNSIPENVAEKKAVIADKTDVMSKTTERITVDKSTMNVYHIAEEVRNKISASILNILCKDCKTNYIVGWDKLSEVTWMKFGFNVKVSDDYIKEGTNKIGTLKVLHNPNAGIMQNGEKKNMFILVNAIQQGAAKKQIMNIKSMFGKQDKIYFVAQDFQEILTADAVDEMLENMCDLVKEFNNYDCKVLFCHENPIYNLAAAETQIRKIHTMQESVETLNALQTRFGYLLPNKIKQSEILKQIINKLGK